MDDEQKVIDDAVPATDEVTETEEETKKDEPEVEENTGDEAKPEELM